MKRLTPAGRWIAFAALLSASSPRDEAPSHDRAAAPKLVRRSWWTHDLVVMKRQPGKTVDELFAAMNPERARRPGHMVKQLRLQ